MSWSLWVFQSRQYINKLILDLEIILLWLERKLKTVGQGNLEPDDCLKVQAVCSSLSSRSGRIFWDRGFLWTVIMFRIFVQISNFDPLVRRHENSRQFILYCMTQMDKSGLLLYMRFSSMCQLVFTSRYNLWSLGMSWWSDTGMSRRWWQNFRGEADVGASRDLVYNGQG